ncbi:hypothetical protein CAEBREN_02935 [Caenorhabditis brenneri]|uniref:Uncharacterized protein n=1 Tax=Caenorhabditis brenneri TaxID=135651 RepID=G0NEQ5_CAEBE|nr:hypothetical protein CAEBREN_02935 [Caenorhabditis brenneri]
MKIPLENGLIREWKKNKRCDVVMENGQENDPENELGSDPDTQRMKLAELKRRGEPFEVPRKWWIQEVTMNDWTSKRRMAPEKMILDNQIDQLPSEKMLKNFPIENPFTILGSLDFHDEMKKKMKRPKSEKLHPVLRVNYHCSENRILGSPILPPGVWNTRFPKIKPNKKLETPINQENVREMGTGGWSENQQDSLSTSAGPPPPRQSMEWSGKRHKRRSKRHGRGKKRTGKWKRDKWHVVERKGRRRRNKKQMVEERACDRKNEEKDTEDAKKEKMKVEPEGAEKNPEAKAEKKASEKAKKDAEAKTKAEAEAKAEKKAAEKVKKDAEAETKAEAEAEEKKEVAEKPEKQTDENTKKQIEEEPSEKAQKNRVVVPRTIASFQQFDGDDGLIRCYFRPKKNLQKCLDCLNK